jgi:16S rRNA C967 or C1407 C5-methylase (RsmB/RsmF family)
VVKGFLARTRGARDLTHGLTAAWPARPDGHGPGYQVLPGESGMDGFYYACLAKPL